MVDKDELWNLHYNLAKIIVLYLEEFKQRYNHDPEWNQKLTLMINSFQSVVDDTVSENESFDEGLKLFAEHYLDLWC